VCAASLSRWNSFALMGRQLPDSSLALHDLYYPSNADALGPKRSIR
jgi:hypothetical protein